MRSSRTLALGLGLLGLACNSSSNAGKLRPDDASMAPGAALDAGPPVDTSVVIESECAFLERCVPRALLVYPGGDRASCVEYGLADFNGPAGGTAAYGDSNRCLEWIQSHGCDLPILWVNFGTNAGLQGLAPGGVLPYRGAPDACIVSAVGSPPLRTQAPVGEPCLDNGQAGCVDEAFCLFDQPLQQRGRNLCGVCKPRATEGKTCSDSLPCDVKTFCEAAICRPRLPLGSPCTSPRQCADNWCGQEGTCVANPYWSLPVLDGASAGASCSEEDQNRCSHDLTLACVAGVCVSRADVGEACDSANDCRLGLRCVENRCSTEPAPPVNLDACGDLERCPEGMKCDWRSGVCKALGREGEDCSPACLEGLICNQCTHTCMVPVPLHSQCTADSDCAEGVCAFDLSKHCTFKGNSYECLVSGCTEKGTCVPKAQASDCR
ncbi:MAG: hypothetical protein QM778_38540 [Myxococcales bacterium]